MFPKIKKCETNINVILDEPLTSDSCTKLIVEFIKYVLYQKQQIPFTYDSLVHLNTKIKKADRNSSYIKTLLSALKSISDNLSSELLLKGCIVKEIVIIIGATIFSPKLQISMELPAYILNSLCHAECQHSSQKPLLTLMRSMMECSEFQDAMTLPLGPTNTFLLLQKSDSNSISNFFLPKPQYISPMQVSSSFRIKLLNNDQLVVDCNCANLVKIYREMSNGCNKDDSIIKFEVHSDEQTVLAPFQWYQSREIIKGFKYIR